MWNRRDLKEQGKAALHRNYWKSVLVALLISFLIGGSGSAAASGMISGLGSGFSSGIESATDDYYYSEDFYDDYDYYEDDFFDDNLFEDDYYEDDYYDDYDYDDLYGSEDLFDEEDMGLFVGLFAMILGIILVVLVISIATDVFLISPLQVGANRFFVKNLYEAGEIKELAFGYDHGYLNVVKILFLKGLFEGLWSLLFVIPGIVKSYEYKMIPYLLAENPEMSRVEAFERSKEMMSGNKWKAFVLDLSFIPWLLLSGMTMGIVGIFYVNPYIYGTYAALYEAIKLETYGPYRGPELEQGPDLSATGYIEDSEKETVSASEDTYSDNSEGSTETDGGPVSLDKGNEAP